MNSAFLKGMASIDLFPSKSDRQIDLSKIALPNEKAFQSDLEAVGKDMWNAINIIKIEHPECK